MNYEKYPKFNLDKNIIKEVLLDDTWKFLYCYLNNKFKKIL